MRAFKLDIDLFKINLINVMLITSFSQSALSSSHQRIPKIAIVGGGIGGASTAFFLRELFGQNGARIDIYEASSIGGRLATANIAGREFETGGSIIHTRNKYMRRFAKILDLETNAGRPSQIALYDGDDFVFRSSDYSLVTLMKMLWRYGLGPIKLDSFINGILNQFDRIYDLQENGESYETVSELLNAMSPSFVDALTNTTYEGLKREYLPDKMINELVEATLRVNYGQNTSAHLFVGCVSVAGATDDLFSIKGGNKQVPEKLLNISDINVINGLVRTVTLNTETDSGSYIVNYTLNIPEIPVNVERAEFYDIVILATPQTTDMLHRVMFKNFSTSFEFSGIYHRTVCTLVSGQLNRSYFSLGKDDPDYDIFSISNRTFFNSVSTITSVNRKKTPIKVYKVFSKNILTDTQMKLLFSKIDEVKIIDWLAYPDYDTSKRTDKFVLHDRIFHVNAIEWAASAMEMSAIGGKNVALLAYKSWTSKRLPMETPNKRRKYEL